MARPVPWKHQSNENRIGFKLMQNKPVNQTRGSHFALDPHSKLALVLFCRLVLDHSTWKYISLNGEDANISRILVFIDHHENSNPGDIAIPNSRGSGTQPGAAHDTTGASNQKISHVPGH